MKNSNLKNQDDFQNRSQEFEALVMGSKMAKYSCVILIAFSIGMMAYADKNLFIIGSLCVGIGALIFYMIKYLSLNTIAQKSYTQTSLNSSISNFKTFLNRRKKFEMY